MMLKCSWGRGEARVAEVRGGGNEKVRRIFPI